MIRRSARGQRRTDGRGPRVPLIGSRPLTSNCRRLKCKLSKKLTWRAGSARQDVTRHRDKNTDTEQPLPPAIEAFLAGVIFPVKRSLCTGQPGRQPVNAARYIRHQETAQHSGRLRDAAYGLQLSWMACVGCEAFVGSAGMILLQVAITDASVFCKT